MAGSISASANRRGRPRTTGTGTNIGVRLLPGPLADLDAWIARQPDKPSRPEAIRRLILDALGNAGDSGATLKKVAKQKPAPEKPE